jgi:hypothetical protein
MTNTYIPLATITLGSAAASVSFGSIPSSYRDLVISAQGRAATATSFFRVRFNGDTGTNYNFLNMMNDGETPFSSNTTGQNGLDIDFFGNALTTADNIYQIQIMDYSATDKHKTVLTRNNFFGATSADRRVAALSARWASTSAISSISIFLNSGNIAAGARFDLYGIAS